MKFIVLFEDNPDAAPDIRKTHMEAHLAFLEAQGGAVSTAGPLSTLGGAAAGGLWIVEAGSAEEVEALVHKDPFWPTGLRKSVSILAWKQVLVDGRRQV